MIAPEDLYAAKIVRRFRLGCVFCMVTLLIPALEHTVESSQPARGQTVKVAAVQCSSDLGDVAANVKKLTALARTAAANGAKIIVLPEASVTGYLSQDGKTNWHVSGRTLATAYSGRDPAGVAETVPGPSTRHFCKLAKELGVYLTVPLVEVDYRNGPEKPRYFNTACLMDHQGKMVLHYRKINPWPYAEKSWATPGDRGIQTFDTEYGRVGIAICYDIYTILDNYKSKELWTLLYPTSWADSEYPAEWFYHKLPNKVKPYNVNVIDANWSVDEKQSWRGYGFSTIISNEGKVLATAKSIYGSEIVYADLVVAKKSASQPSGCRQRVPRRMRRSLRA